MRTAAITAALLWPLAAASGQTARISVDSSGGQVDLDCLESSVSADGRFAAFSTSAALIAADTNGYKDVYVVDLGSGQLSIASVDSAGNLGNRDSFTPALSADGHAVAFVSVANNIVSGDWNNVADVFVHDFQAGTSVCASWSSTTGFGNGASGAPCINSDGTFVAFESNAANLVAGDTNRMTDIFVRDVSHPTVPTRVSVSTGGVQGNHASNAPAISGDGTKIVFQSESTNFLSHDLNKVINDVYLRDTVALTTTLVSVDESGAQLMSGGSESSISADGTRVSFDGELPGDVNYGQNVLMRDIVAATTTLISRNLSGVDGQGDSFESRISADGSVVVFASVSDDLVENDTNGMADVFIRDLAGDYVQRVSVSTQGDEPDQSSGDCPPAISGDGVIVAFCSAATNLVPSDTNGVRDVFTRTRAPNLASSSNYGAGWPGTLGIPGITTTVPPVFSQKTTIHIDNSSTWWTLGFMFVGAVPASIPTPLGGDLLVDYVAMVSVAVGPAGAELTFGIVDDATLYGLSGYAQALELDAGASRGVSFTPGLELILGR